jgi:hypothetical protein
MENHPPMVLDMKDFPFLFFINDWRANVDPG